ncbi:hypothetical protein QQ020_05395 [Fulvivirgaceae bacterium BMA12]|uniref:Uncharacterized protein n=1 Tax=Agaribacillus aureus TaxID=3051825 RepID=A0ABT8L2K4_9BACT|nr:hypothetical protein [Fulvivirgaceae bacterium BMA12]
MNPHIVHQYFKKELEEGIIIVQVDPTSLKGVELLISKNGGMQKNKRDFDEDIYEDLAADNFVDASPLEFNLYLKGLTGIK